MIANVLAFLGGVNSTCCQAKAEKLTLALNAWMPNLTAFGLKMYTTLLDAVGGNTTTAGGQVKFITVQFRGP
jgi:hypothetical protein